MRPVLLCTGNPGGMPAKEQPRKGSETPDRPASSDSTPDTGRGPSSRPVPGQTGTFSAPKDSRGDPGTGNARKCPDMGDARGSQGNPRTRPHEQRRQKPQEATATPDTADQHSRHLRATRAKTHGQQASVEGNAEGTTAHVSRQTRLNPSRGKPAGTGCAATCQEPDPGTQGIPEAPSTLPENADPGLETMPHLRRLTRCSRRRWQAQRKGKDRWA